MLRRVISVVLYVVVLASSADLTVGEDEPPSLSGINILKQVRLRLPAEPLRITGQTTVRQGHGMRRGMVEARFRFVFEIDFSAEPPEAAYQIFSVSNEPPERLDVVFSAGETTLSYYTGMPPASALPPALSEQIKGSALTWRDLVLDYLWWSDAVVIGREELRGRNCLVLEVSPPTEETELDAVRIWVDEENLLLMQAEAVSGGDAVRRMRVRSIKKIGGRWMLKDLEVEIPGSRQRTRLSVEEVTATGRS